MAAGVKGDNVQSASQVVWTWVMQALKSQARGRKLVQVTGDGVIANVSGRSVRLSETVIIRGVVAARYGETEDAIVWRWAE